MTQSTAVTVPQNITLPAHLQTADAVARIAAANAAAAGGIKASSFPRLSIKGSRFHIKENGETVTLMAPPQPGQPALPVGCLEVVIAAANPALTKLCYVEDYAEGEDREPDCSSSNGITPDAHILKPFHTNCAQCPKNAWGSKVSKMSGKDIKACDDNKVLAVLAPNDIKGKVLGLTVTKSALTDWGKYVHDLTQRGLPIDAIVTNLTFDHTAAYPKLQFAFNRCLTAEDYAAVQERIKADDVQRIVAQTRAAVPQLPAPAAAPALAPVQPAAAAAAPAVQAPPVEPAPAAAAPAPTVATGGFGGAPVAPAATTAAPAATPPAEPAKRTRAKRQPAPPVEVPVHLAHLPAAILAAVQAVGETSPAGQALLAQYPAPQPAPIVQQPAAAPVAPAAPVTAPAPVAPATTAPAAPVSTGGFGAGVAAPVAPVKTAPTPQVTASAANLKELLAKKLAGG